jgi:glycosyltransferase involved in cell wall biosynthesis
MSTNKRIIIGVDGNEANRENRVGVNTYAYETLRAMHKLQDEWSGTYLFRIYLKEQPLPHMPKSSESWEYQVLPGSGLWIIKSLMPVLYTEKNKPQILWSPSHYVAPFSPQPKICSIMDLGYLEFSEQFTKKDFWQLKLWTAWSLLVSKKVISISETTRKDIVRHYPFTRNKITTTLLGYDSELYNKSLSESKVNLVKRKYGLKDYVIFMSTLKPSKNVEGLIHAWKQVVAQFPHYKLVIAGKKGWLYESIFEIVKTNNLESSVVFTDFVPEEEKPYLIKGAQLFVLPSFWEGFGLDVLSALAMGIPVVVSNRGSLPEVVREAGIVVDPKDHNSISNGILTVLTLTSAEKKALIKKGFERASEFSWEATARKTLSVLQSAIK